MISENIKEVKIIFIVLFLSTIFGSMIYLMLFAYPNFEKEMSTIKKKLSTGVKIYQIDKDSSLYLIPRQIECSTSLFFELKCESKDIDIGIHKSDKFFTFGKVNDFYGKIKSFNISNLDIEGYFLLKNIQIDNAALSDFFLIQRRKLNDATLDIAEKDIFNKLKPFKLEFNVKMKKNIRSNIDLKIVSPILNYNANIDFLIKYIKNNKINLKIPNDLMKDIGYSEIDAKLPDIEFFIKNLTEKLEKKQSFKDFAYNLYIFNSIDTDLTQYNYYIVKQKIEHLLSKDDFESKIYPYIDQLLIDNSISFMKPVYKMWKNEYFSEEDIYQSEMHSSEGLPLLRAQYISNFGKELFERLFKDKFTFKDFFK